MLFVGEKGGDSLAPRVGDRVHVAGAHIVGEANGAHIIEMAVLIGEMRRADERAKINGLGAAPTDWIRNVNLKARRPA